MDKQKKVFLWSATIILAIITVAAMGVEARQHITEDVVYVDNIEWVDRYDYSGYNYPSDCYGILDLQISLASDFPRSVKIEYRTSSTETFPDFQERTTVLEPGEDTNIQTIWEPGYKGIELSLGEVGENGVRALKSVSPSCS